jgi:hypothetical protein
MRGVHELERGGETRQAAADDGNPLWTNRHALFTAFCPVRTWPGSDP